jgi:type IV secretory pathway TrbL component
MPVCRSLFVLPGLAATALLGAIATQQVASATPATSTVLRARLTGAYLHTTSKGSGTAKITFKGGDVCWKFAYSGLDTPGDSGVHVAPPPAAGVHKTSVFPFTASTSSAAGCVAADHWARPARRGQRRSPRTRVAST